MVYMPLNETRKRCAMNKEEVEEIILIMADIVMENRELREKITHLEESDRWYRHNLADTCKISMDETKK